MCTGPVPVRTDNSGRAGSAGYPPCRVRCLLPPSTIPGRKREYHRVLWIIAALLAVHFLMHLPGEYSLLVALILAALLPAFG